MPPRGEPKAELANVERLAFKRKCDVCGQVFDTRDQDQVFHHGVEPHEPLKPAAPR
jgi:hypothetical protein